MLLSEPDRQRVREMLAGMTRRVRLLFFTRTIGCDTCDDAKRIVDEVASLHDGIDVEEVNLILDEERAAALGIEAAPAIVVQAELEDGTTWDPGVRFLGITAGYEFTSLVDAIRLVSTGESGLSAATRALVAQVTAPLHLQVFVTPT